MMSDHLPDEWIALISAWAVNEPGVQRVYLYGSRVKGASRPDSDLDIAVVPHAVNDETAITVGFFGQDRWGETLARLLPVQVHLQAYEPEYDTAAVGKGVSEHGICIFDRELAAVAAVAAPDSVLRKLKPNCRQNDAGHQEKQKRSTRS